MVIGHTGAIGGALLAALTPSFGNRVRGLSRSAAAGGSGGSGDDGATGSGNTTHVATALDLLDEASIARAAAVVAAEGKDKEGGGGGPLRLIIDATGVLAWPGHSPERSWRAIDPAAMAHSYAVNAIGPALLMKHFLPLLPRDDGGAVFATLSARVGSIHDNSLGGWYSYRAAKAALHQLVRCASVELRRTHPAAVCVALHPGTVASRLTAPYSKAGLEVQSPEDAAARIIAVIEALHPAQSGNVYDHMGVRIPF